MKRLRTLFVIVGLGFWLLGIAACAPIPGGVTQQQLDTASKLAREVGQLQQVVEETAGELQAMEERVASAENQVAGFTAVAELHALDRTVTIPDPPAGRVALRLSFQYLPQPLPGQGIRAYEPTPEVSSLWAMDSLAAGQPLPVGVAIPDSTLFLEPGESRTVTLAYENPSSEDVGFLVMPHQESPGHLAPYIWPTCLCMSMVYEAPAQGAWYRVIRLTVSPEIPLGSKVDTTWLILTDPSVFPTRPELEAEVEAASEVKVAASLDETGEMLAAQNGCLACHSTDGSPKIGPTWKGLFGKKEMLADGSEITVDEAYLYESIVNPNAKVVKGFPAEVMPQDFGQKLADSEIQAIIEYIKTVE